MSFASGARLTLSVPLVKPLTGNRKVFPTLGIGAPTLAPAAAAPLSSRSLKSTPTTVSENVMSTLTDGVAIVDPATGFRVSTVGGVMSPPPAKAIKLMSSNSILAGPVLSSEIDSKKCTRTV